MTASRLADAMGDGGALSRIGGDEFVVVIKGDDVEKRAVDLAEAAAEVFAKPFEVRGSAFVLHASIGIALYSVPNESEIDLLKKADLAMYSAKDAGKNCYQFYSPQLSHRADHLMKWEQQLRVALSEGQLFLAYQPKIDLTRRCITGFEALVRWNHPQHGLIPANEFIPVAESTGLIVPIGDFVIETACRQLALWQQQGYDSLSLAVNISAVQFWRGDLYETISHAIEETGISARRLELEITETAMMEYPELVSEKIFALKRLGVRIALDDFGTGYSSLSYLNRFSVDTLKVDRSFVQAIPGDRSVCVMVTAIVNLARSLGLTVVVEGTETEEQIAWLVGARSYRSARLPVLAPGAGRRHSGAARTLRCMRHAGATQRTRGRSRQRHVEYQGLVRLHAGSAALNQSHRLKCIETARRPGASTKNRLHSSRTDDRARSPGHARRAV